VYAFGKVFKSCTRVVWWTMHVSNWPSSMEAAGVMRIPPPYWREFPTAANMMVSLRVPSSVVICTGCGTNRGNTRKIAYR
jgi:hypothetical protein